MKTIAGLALAAALLVTWLCFIGTETNSSRNDRAMAILNQFVATGSELRENILNARLGLLRDYDLLDRETIALHQSLRILKDTGVATLQVSSLRRTIDRQDELTEQFKSNNALLQNALAYFGLMSSQAGFGVYDEATNTAVTALSTSVLHLMLDPSPTSAEQVQNDLNRFAKQQDSRNNDVKNGLLAHGQSLHDLLPATDNILRSLYDLPIAADETAVRSTILARQKAATLRAEQHRVGLYAVSLTLLLLLTLLGLQLTRILQTLKRRAAFEHAMAGISMTFVNARAADLPGVVENALAELSRWVGADRAYFVEPMPPQLFTWSYNGDGWLRGWPGEKPPSFPDIEEPSATIRYYPSIKRMAAGPDKDALLAAGLSGWLFIPAPGSDALPYALGFEALAKPLTWPRSDLVPLSMAAGNIANAVGRARMELEHGRLEASLQQARRMETVGALTSGVAHNFNNVIGAILGHTEMQEAEVDPATRLAEHVQGVRQAAERARDLVEQILHFGHRKEPSERRVPLALLLAETVTQLRAALPVTVQLVVEHVPDGAVVYCDPTQLQQIIMNLCNNASQAMGGSGIVRMVVDVSVISAPLQLSHASLPPGSYARLTVADTGNGMTAATLERLFEPFFTTRPDGNGLGLATAYEIVTSYAGGMNVSSRLGKGSTFEVWLPLAVTGDAALDGRSHSRVRGRGETISIVNEDPGRLLHDEEVIAALGYEPIGYSDLRQALDACRQAPHRFDVILVSNVRSTAAALTFGTDLHAISPNLPIILAAASDGLSAEGLAVAGICEVVKTPITSAELAAALPRWLPRH